MGLEGAIGENAVFVSLSWAHCHSPAIGNECDRVTFNCDINRLCSRGDPGQRSPIYTDFVGTDDDRSPRGVDRRGV
jgi:hypothetical protein